MQISKYHFLKTGLMQISKYHFLKTGLMQLSKSGLMHLRIKALWRFI